MSARPAVPNNSPLLVHPSYVCHCPFVPLCFQSLPTIKLNYPMRIVHPERSEGSLCAVAPVYQCPLPALYFQQLPTIKFHNPFVLITMQIAPGVAGGVAIFQFRFSSFQSQPAKRCTHPLLFSCGSALFAHHGDLQPLPHQPLAHSFPLDGGGRGYVFAIYDFRVSIFESAGVCRCRLPISIFQFPSPYGSGLACLTRRMRPVVALARCSALSLASEVRASLALS